MCKKPEALFFKRLGIKGLSYIELLVSMGIMMGAAVAVGGVAEITAAIANHRRLVTNSMIFSSIVNDQMRFGARCGDMVAGITLPTSGGAVVLTPNAGPTSVGGFDAAGSTDVALNIPLLSQHGTIVSATGTQAILPDYLLRVDRLQITNLKKVDPTCNSTDANCEYLGLLRAVVSTTRRQLWGGTTLPPLILGSITLRANDGTGVVEGCGGLSAQNPEDLCAEMPLCTWNDPQDRCECPATPVEPCPENHVLDSVSADGVPNCRFVGGECAAGQFVVGVGIENVSCAPYPNCSAGVGALSWRAGGNYCVNDAAINAPSEAWDPSSGLPSPTPIQLNAVDTNPGSGNGTATIRCVGGIFSDLQGVSCTAASAPTATPTVAPTAGPTPAAWCTPANIVQTMTLADPLAYPGPCTPEDPPPSGNECLSAAGPGMLTSIRRNLGGDCAIYDIECSCSATPTPTGSGPGLGECSFMGTNWMQGTVAGPFIVGVQTDRMYRCCEGFPNNIYVSAFDPVDICP